MLRVLCYILCCLGCFSGLLEPERTMKCGVEPKRSATKNWGRGPAPWFSGGFAPEQIYLASCVLKSQGTRW
jgi:hypothetical protein